jgi:hypothetical protein
VTVTVSPPIAVLCHSSSVVDGLPTVTGTVEVNLDDGRCLHARQPDLLAAVADLAQRRPVLDETCGLLLDPLPSPTGSDLIVLQLRLDAAGEEIGTRQTTGAALDAVLDEAWEQLHRYATRNGDAALLDELLIPHTEHYWPRLTGPT